MDPYLAEIRCFAGNFAPLQWAYCHGQLLSIAENSALFALIGTIYGGDGQNTFALPDLRGRVPVGDGQGPGLAVVTQGEMAGEVNHTLLVTEMPAHTHTATVTATAPAASVSTTATPSNSVAPGPASLGAGKSKGFGTPDGNLAPPTVAAPSIGTAGGSQPHNNMQPYLGMNYIICVEGIFPSRN